MLVGEYQIIDNPLASDVTGTLLSDTNLVIYGSLGWALYNVKGFLQTKCSPPEESDRVIEMFWSSPQCYHILCSDDSNKEAVIDNPCAAAEGGKVAMLHLRTFLNGQYLPPVPFHRLV